MMIPWLYRLYLLLPLAVMVVAGHVGYGRLFPPASNAECGAADSLWYVTYSRTAQQPQPEQLKDSKVRVVYPTAFLSVREGTLLITKGDDTPTLWAMRSGFALESAHELRGAERTAAIAAMDAARQKPATEGAK